jgi:hypothetical protein
MIFEALQSLIQIFSMPTLYVTVAWFGVVGLMVHGLVTILITKMRYKEIIPVVFKLHLMSLIISYVVSPVCTMIIVGLQAVLYPNLMIFMVAPNLYIWYSLCMIVSMRYLLCHTFASVPCRTWYILLLGSDIFVAVMGYIFLQLLHLI